MTQTATTGIQNKALLVNLNISTWSGRKYDQKATREVEEAHNAQSGEAGRFNKMLTSKDFLSGITKVATAARQYLYENTMPWGKNGDMLLPSANYFDFTAGMLKFENEFNAEVSKAESKLDEELIIAKLRLNGLFNRDEYPSAAEFRSKFSMNVFYMPMPDTKDFRVDLNDTEVNVIKQSIENEVNNRINAAMANIWERIKDQLTHMKERLTSTRDNGDAAIFKNSLFDNLADLIALLPKLNVTGSPEIEVICEDMKALLVDPDKVRESALIRTRTAQEVNDILNKFDSFFN